MPVGDLKTTYPAGAHLVSGKTLNEQNIAINSATNGRGGGGSMKGVSNVDLPPVPFIMGVGVVIDNSNQCPIDADAGEFDAPCATVNKYLVRFRYFDTHQGIWVKYDEDLRFDAAAYYEPVDSQAGAQSLGPGFGPIPTYTAGDTLCGWFDVQRGWFIPVSVPPEDKPVAEFVSYATEEVQESNLITDEGVVEFYIDAFRPGFDNDWRTVAGVAFPLLAQMDREYFDTRSCFTTLSCTSGTMFRVRSVRAENTADTSFTVTTKHQTLRIVGLGRRHTFSSPGGAEYDAFGKGGVTAGWFLNGSTVGRYKDTPGFGVVHPQIMMVGYLDFLDQWILGVELFVEINVDFTDGSSSSPSSPSSTSPSSTSPSSQSSTSPSSQSSTSPSSNSSSSQSISTSSSSQSISTSSSSQSISTSSSSQSISTSSSRGSSASSDSSSAVSTSDSSSSSYDCIQYVRCVEFNEETCELTVTCAEFCLPKAAGLIKNRDAACDCD